MDERYVAAGWPRQYLQIVPQPSWPLSHPGQAWLLLNGERLPSLTNAIRALSSPGEHEWIWRGTADEYKAPGYQAGPLLVRANQQLLNQFINVWAPQQAGLILFGPNDSAALVDQLRRLRHIRAADGNTLALQLQNLRRLEELCEALPRPHLQRMLSPIQRMIWHSGLAPDSWLQQAIAENPVAAVPLESLTSTDELALNSASHAWFMRHACHVLGQHLQAMGVHIEPLTLHRQLADFDKEAGYCGFHLEDDRRYYMQLRLFFPEDPFVKDRAISDLLLDTETQGRQRLMEINDRLLDISTPLLSRTQ